MTDAPTKHNRVERESLDSLYAAAYEQLRRLAAAVRRTHGHKPVELNTTTLLHEAWLKLAEHPQFRAQSELHFRRIAARAMRQVLVDAARRHVADKRGGGVLTATYCDDAPNVRVDAGSLLELDVALDDLARLEPRQAEIVVCRYFGGLSTHETAVALGVAERTVSRDLRFAKAWLAVTLRPEPGSRGEAS